MNSNKYPGTCDHCRASVPANTGIYTWGIIYCSEAHMADAEQAFEDKKAAEARELQTFQRTVLIPDCIANYALTEKQVANLVGKVTGKRTGNVEDLEDDELILFLGAMHKYVNRATRVLEVKQLKSDGKCVRCGGVGRADKWERTGSVCYECHGSGKRIA